MLFLFCLFDEMQRAQLCISELRLEITPPENDEQKKARRARVAVERNQTIVTFTKQRALAINKQINKRKQPAVLNVSVSATTSTTTSSSSSSSLTTVTSSSSISTEPYVSASIERVSSSASQNQQMDIASVPMMIDQQVFLQFYFFVQSIH